MERVSETMAGEVETAGHFRIYLGAAAGVGKTYAMLNEGRRRREHMTGARVRECVPDWVVRQADQVELVDSSPEQLRRRMLHGNIYPKERVTLALSNFFRIDNLTALREMALRFLADETDEDLLEHLRRHEPDAVWETCERVTAAVTWPSARRPQPRWRPTGRPASPCRAISVMLPRVARASCWRD
jgi:two-component system, OmpR family, sensor histidine kinase KdpD